MNVIAVYNIKGGVGKTTTAVNLSYMAAAGGRRVLLWDLDLQAASTFTLRVRPRVAGFGKKSLESGEAFAAAIRETDYDNLDLLPADFAYRKFDWLLGELGKPAPVLAALLTTLGRDYDVVILDCPPGFSLIAEGIFAAADVVLVPTIPTVLSLRTVARIIKCGGRRRFSVTPGGVLQHGRSPQSAAPVRIRLDREPFRGVPEQRDPVRQRRGADDGAPHAARRVRAARPGDESICTALGRAPNAGAAATTRGTTAVSTRAGDSLESHRIAHHAAGIGRQP